MVLDMDTVLSHIGEMGRFAQWECFLAFWPVFLGGAHVVANAFLGYTAPQRCLVPGCDDPSGGGPYEAPHTDFTIPTDAEGHLSECLMHVHTPLSVACNASAFSSDNVTCPSHVYDRSLFAETTISEFDISCDKAWL